MTKQKNKYTLTWAEKLLRPRVDTRTKWGKDAWRTIREYVKNKNASALSLLSGLVEQFPEKYLIDLLNVDPIDYQRNVKSTCVCGHSVSRELYVMRMKNSNIEFHLGEDHYKGLPKLLDSFGFSDLKNTTIKSQKRKKDLEELSLEGLTPDMRLSLENEGIKIEEINEFIKLNSLFKRSGISIEGIVYEIDPGKDKSFFNWLSENISKGKVQDQEITTIYHKLEKVPNLVKDSDIFKLAKYSYENRMYETDSVIGGFKEDLTYLNSLNRENDLIKKLGNPLEEYTGNFDCEERWNRTSEIIERLGRTHMTMKEARELKLKFPNLERIRKKANRVISDKYGLGMEWHNLSEKIKPLFEEIKYDLNEEYKKFGETIKDYVLTKEEYIALKDFYKRSKIGRRSNRENYLRMFPIKKFEVIAPKVMIIGRKVRMAEKEYQKSKNEWVWRDLLKQDYILKEDFANKMGYDPKHLIEMISDTNILGLKNKNLKKFQESHGNIIEQMYENGLIAKKYISKLKNESSFEKYSKLLEREGVEKISEDLSTRMNNVDRYVHEGLICVNGKNPFENMSRKFISKKGNMMVENACLNIEGLIKSVGLDFENLKEIKKQISELKGFGNPLYVSKGAFSLFSIEEINADYTNKAGMFSVPYLPSIKKNLKNLRNSFEVNKEVFDKLIKINEAHNLLGVNQSYFDLSEGIKGKRWYVEKSVLKKIEELYSRLRVMERNRMFDRY